MAKQTKTAKRKSTGLGRGLSALMGDEAPAPSGAARAAGREVPIELLHRNRYQPRVHFDDDALKDLAASIAEQGVLQPILVRPHPEREGHHEIIAGERRWRAAQLARLHQVPIVERTFSDDQALEVALIENIQRENLSPVEEAKGYARLTDEFGHSHEKIAEAVGKSRSHITNLLRLLTLPDPVLALIDEGKLTAGHARALIGADDVAALAKKIVAEGLSVRQVEELMRSDGVTAIKLKSVKTPPKADADTRALEQRVSELLGLVVKIKHGKGESGAITIKYEAIEQLDAILDKLGS